MTMDACPSRMPSSAALRALPVCRPVEQRHRHAEGLEPAAEILRMLIGQQFGRRHQRDLPAHLNRLSRRQRGNQRLAAAHVALHQAQHGLASIQDRASISSSARCCALVMRNGSAASRPAFSAPFAASGQPGSL